MRDWEDINCDRLRIYYVREEILLRSADRLLKVSPLLPHNLVLESPPLPEGYEVVRVYHAPERRAFAFIVYHQDFDVVASGEIPPEMIFDYC